MIKTSVGRGGLNKKRDVLIVQGLLNQYIESLQVYVFALLKEDGLCGKQTIATIGAFQADVVGMASPDGRIDPGGGSIKALQKFDLSMPRVRSGIPLTTAPKVVPSTAKSGARVNPGATTQTDPRQLKTRADVAAVYGAISADKKWAKMSEFLAAYTVPQSISGHADYRWVNVYDPKKRKVSKIWCHKAMHQYLDAALKNVKDRGILSELTEFGGSHSIRATRGTTNWSAHSWALAIDVNMTGNGLGQVPKMSAEFAQCFIDAGFGWGGHYSRQDGMHFTIAGFDMPRIK